MVLSIRKLSVIACSQLLALINKYLGIALVIGRVEGSLNGN